VNKSNKRQNTNGETTTLQRLPLIVRRKDLKPLIGVSPSFVDLAEKRGEWPKRVHFFPGVVGYHGPELEEFIEHLVRIDRKNINSGGATPNSKRSTRDERNENG